MKDTIGAPVPRQEDLRLITARAGPYRGVARPAGVFAMESVIDSAARALDLSGAAIRRNLIPQFVIGHLARPAASPLGVRGVGGGGTLGPAAALADAAGDALGVGVDRLAITPGPLWELIRP